MYPTCVSSKLCEFIHIGMFFISTSVCCCQSIAAIRRDRAIEELLHIGRRVYPGAPPPLHQGGEANSQTLLHQGPHRLRFTNIRLYHHDLMQWQMFSLSLFEFSMCSCIFWPLNLPISLLSSYYYLLLRILSDDWKSTAGYNKALPRCYPSEEGRFFFSQKVRDDKK